MKIKGSELRQRRDCCISTRCWKWIFRMKSWIRCLNCCLMSSTKICNCSHSMHQNTQDCFYIFTKDSKKQILNSEQKPLWKSILLLIQSTLFARYLTNGCFQPSTRSSFPLYPAKWWDRAFTKDWNGVSSFSLMLPSRTWRRTRSSSLRNSLIKASRTISQTPIKIQ